MSLVLAIDDLKPEQVKRTKPGRTGSTDTIFFKATSDAPNSPTAFLVEYIPGRLSGAHYHAADQFQILVRGNGTIGRHAMSPYCIHFARAHTPYGPLQSDKERGWAFLTLRTRYDPGKQSFPAAQEKLKQISDRQPWQITKKVTLPSPGPGIRLEEVPEIKDEQGLFACSLTMAPNTRTTTPDASGGDGQFVVVVKGSLVHGNREHKALTIVFIKPVEDAFQIDAGPQGLEGLILNFPQVKPRATRKAAPSTIAGLRKWQCLLCDFTYDEAQGMPEEGIPAGTRWQDVPDTWSCPDCSASKSDFQMIEVQI